MLPPPACTMEGLTAPKVGLRRAYQLDSLTSSRPLSPQTSIIPAGIRFPIVLEN